MHICFYLAILLILGIKCDKEEEEEYDSDVYTYPELDVLLFELDNVIDEELQSIPEDLISKCQLALAFWSIDGREDHESPPSIAEDHRNANRLMNKIKETYLSLGGDPLDREGFVRDVFTLEQKWFISAIEYYSYIKYYDPSNPSYIYKLIEWTVYPHDYVDGFARMYHLERSYSEQFGYTYVLGRKTHPHYHESLIFFNDYSPTYMELKSLIIGDITGQTPLQPVISSGHLE